MSLIIKNLNFSVKGKNQIKQLLKNINANIDSAKLVGIIGPNGAGKSTLINCISGLVPTYNNIKLNNQALETYAQMDLAKIRAALPQASPLSFPFMAKDIVAMSFAMSAVSLAEQNQVITDCLAMMSAIGLADRSYLNLSGGEKQRVQLARVFAQLLHNKSSNQSSEQMRLLLLDEPTAPLDLKYQFQLFKHLKAFVNQRITTIVVIHDINLAATYCDEIWVMKDGELIKQGRPHEVISNTMMKEVFEVDVNISYQNNQLLPVISNISQ